MAGDKKFNIRVYGLLVWQNRVLVSDEWLWDKAVTKFPGGGLEWGEGIAQCLEREFMEELELPVTVGKVFYLNDFFQPSAYNSQHQVISIYYLVHTESPQNITVKQKPFDFEAQKHGAMAFRWMNLDEITPGDFYFPIDKVVAGLLKNP